LSWKVETLNAAVDKEIAALPLDIRIALVRLFEMIETRGLERMRFPHVRKLRDRLWELRATGKDGIGRAIYVTATGRRVVVVHAFMKKTQNTPKAVLRLAETRAKEIDQ
jgi:phage-related protein